CRARRRYVAAGCARIFVFFVDAEDGSGYRIRLSEVRGTAPAPRGDCAAHDNCASMDRARNWICRFIFRRAGGRRMVYELGARARFRAICGIPDSARSRIVDAVDAWNDVISEHGDRSYSSGPAKRGYM